VNETPRKFKGWTIPGDLPPLVSAFLKNPDSLPSELRVEENESLDVISGHYRLYQLRAGHRFSTDDILVAWYGSNHSSQVLRALDLGSGIGSVATIVAWKFPAARLTTVEAQSDSVRLARKSHRLNGIEARVQVIEGDFREAQAQIAGDKFDLITGSPPYFPLEAGLQSEHPQKIACRFEVRGDVSDYCKTAALHLASAGVFAFVFPIQPPHQAVRVSDALEKAGLCLIRSRPIALKEGEAPLLGLFLAMRADDLPEASRSGGFVEPPLTIRTLEGKISKEYQAVKQSIGFPP
jgi:tRNA1Val (adenine37-N6)-methyltransferase